MLREEVPLLLVMDSYPRGCFTIVVPLEHVLNRFSLSILRIECDSVRNRDPSYKDPIKASGRALVFDSRDMVVIHESRLPALLAGRLTALDGRCRKPTRELAALSGRAFSTALLV